MKPAGQPASLAASWVATNTAINMNGALGFLYLGRANNRRELGRNLDCPNVLLCWDLPLSLGT